MAGTIQQEAVGLRERLGGQVLLPGETGYDESRTVWNGAIDRMPAMIVRCANADDVAAAVKFGRQSGLEISVRGGGHNYSGSAVVDGGLMIHLGDMKSVSMDAAARRVLVGGGATWGDVDAVTQEQGLAVPGGFISHTGVGGLTLGGGVGWLTKLGGLSCDNVVGAEVVTADGSIVHCSATEHPELLWAIRGGGGNFGIVTTFEFQLHQLGPMVNLGLFFWGIESGDAPLRLARDVVSSLPEDATCFIGGALSLPPAPFAPPEYHFHLGNALVVVSYGTPERHAEIVDPLRAKLPPLVELVTPMPFVALQQIFNDAAEWGTFAYEKALFLETLTDEAIALLVEHAPRKGSPLSFCPMFPLRGAYQTLGDNATAFGGSRKAGYVFNVAAHCPEASMYESERQWVRNLWDSMLPHAMGAGGYINFQVEADQERIRATYGAEKYARLAAVKRTYDPDNVFHRNANIQPA